MDGLLLLLLLLSLLVMILRPGRHLVDKIGTKDRRQNSGGAVAVRIGGSRCSRHCLEQIDVFVYTVILFGFVRSYRNENEANRK